MLFSVSLLAPIGKEKKSLEDQITELKQENLKLKQQIEDLSSKIDLLLSRIEKLEQAPAGATTPAQSGDAFEEKPATVKELPGTPNLPVVKVETQPGENGAPDMKVIEIVNPGQKPGTGPESKAAGASEETVGAAKKLVSEKKYAEAEKLISARLDQKPEAKESCALLYYLGLSRAGLGKNADAARAYGELADRYPACEYAAESMFKAGELYEKMGDAGKARKFYEDLSTLYPFSEYAKLAEAKLKK